MHEELPRIILKGDKMAAVQETLPWGNAASWREANQTLSYLVKRYPKELKWAKSCAESIYGTLSSVAGPMASLCRCSCPWCPSPCCLSAKVWMGFQDLLFLYLTEIKVPERQLLTSYTDMCRYLGPRGCTLNRFQRPFICTWYLCPTQKALLRGRDPEGLRFFEKAFDTIKTARVKMEDAFILATTS